MFIAKLKWLAVTEQTCHKTQVLWTLQCRTPINSLYGHYESKLFARLQSLKILDVHVWTGIPQFGFSLWQSLWCYCFAGNSRILFTEIVAMVRYRTTSIQNDINNMMLQCSLGYPHGDTCYLDYSSFCVIFITRAVTTVSYPVCLDPLFCVISALSGDPCYTGHCFKINLLTRDKRQVRYQLITNVSVLHMYTL